MGNEKKYYFLLLAALIIMIFYPYVSTGYTTNDDMFNGLIPFSDFFDMAAAQGRIHFASLHGLFAHGAHVFGNHALVKTVSLLSLVLNIILFGYMIYRLTFSDVFALFCMFFWTAFIGDSWDHFLITSSPLLYTIPLSLLFISVILTERYHSSHKFKYLGLSAFFYFLTLNFSEMFVLFIFIFPLILIYKGYNLRKTAVIMIPHLSVLFFSLTVYLIYRSMHPSDYTGNVVAIHSMSLKNILQTLTTYSLFCFPTSRYVLYISNTSDYLSFLYDGNMMNYQVRNLVTAVGTVFANLKNMPADWIARSVIVSFVSIQLISKLKNFFTKRDFLFLGGLSCLFLFMPNLPHSLTPKYQDWVVKYGSRAYVGTYYSWFGMTLLLSLILFYFKGILKSSFMKKVFYAGIVIIFSFSSILTSAGNYCQVKSKIMSHKKWELFDRFLYSSQFNKVKNDSIVFCPSLINRSIGFATGRPGHWARYTQNKTGKHVLYAGDSDEMVRFRVNYPEGDIYFLKYSQNYNNPEQYIVFSKLDRKYFTETAIQKIMTDSVYIYTLSENTRYLVVSDTAQGVKTWKHTDERLISDKQSETVYLRSEKIYPDSVMVCNNLDFSVHEKNEFRNLVNIKPGKGFYRIDRLLTWDLPYINNGRMHYRSGKESILVLNNPLKKDLRVRLKFVIAGSSEEKSAVRVLHNNKKYKFYPTLKGTNALLSLVLKHGDNKIHFKSDSDKFRQSIKYRGDVFFDISDIKITNPLFK